jgi:pimeloyl-ACP methyl ester carboxylesterase
MVMFDPPYPGGTGRGFQLPHVFNIWYQMFHQLPLAESLVGSSREATRTYISWFLAAWSANRDLFTPEEVEKYTDAYSQPGALRGGFNCYRSAYRGGAFSAGGDAKVMPKTLVLWGDSDAIFPFEFSDQLGNTFDDFELKKIEGAGHFMMREAPDRVNGEIIDFMRG